MNPRSRVSATPQSLVLAAVLSLTGCLHARYTYPVSSWDADSIYPAVMSVAQEQGHTAYLQDANLQVQLTSGDTLYWYTQQNNTVELAIKLGGEVNPADEKARLAATKQQADALWQQGLDARARFGGGTTVVVGAGAAQDCRRGADGVEVCGFNCEMGSNGRVYCAPTPDGRCALNSDGTRSCGRNCRLASNGRHVCH